MATTSCAEECQSRAQKLKLICPPQEEDVSTRTFTVTGNWKMNGDKKLAEEIFKLLRSGNVQNKVIIGIPAPYLEYAQQHKPKGVDIAGQNIYKEGSGNFTGEISANMLLDIGAKWVILGASERKLIFHEDINLVGEKAKYALENGLNVIVCIGENNVERENNEVIEALSNQLEVLSNHIPNSKWNNVIIVYEPLWTKRANKIPSPGEVQEIGSAIRSWIGSHIDQITAKNMRIQYGGAITGSNAKTYTKLPDIDGFYVGAASLKPEFIGIVNANQK